MSSVLQPWLERIPLRMQSTLILGLRGPDTHVCPGVKAIQRWMRGLAFVPGNPENVKEFMGERPALGGIKEKSQLAKELEFCTQHFYSHLMHALEVIAFRHPSEDEALVAHELFASMAVLMHLPPESRTSFELRLRELTWKDGKQPETYIDAVSLLDGEGK